MSTPSEETTSPPMELDTLAAGGARARTMAALFGEPEDSTPAIEGYEVLGVLGRGGMGVVYRARQVKLDRIVAIKRVLPGRLSDRAQERLREEARRLAQFQDPHIVEVFEVGHYRGSPYFVMEYVDGPTAQAWLRTAPGTEAILDVFLQAGRALAAAHAHGVLHLDLKPANILIGPGGVAKVVDFGVAVDVQPTPADADQVTISDAGGTPAYMAPEQFSGQLSPRVDQFSFGVSVLEALCGRSPFADAVAPQLDPQEHARRLNALHTDRVPRRTLDALRRACAFDRNERWPSMDALLDALAPRDRRGGWLLAATLVGVVAVAGLSWRIGTAAFAPSPCVDLQHELDPVWNPARRDALRAAGSGGLSLSNRVDALAETWFEQRVETCNAIEAGAPDPNLDRRAACLSSGRAALDATLQLVLIDPGRAAADPEAVAATLPNLQHCLDPGPLPPIPAARAHEVEQAEALLTQARLLERLDDLEQAAARLDDAEALLEGIAYDPSKARLLQQRGSLALARSEHAAAESLLEDAFERARALDMVDVAALAAQDLAFLIGSADERPGEDADRWLAQATALAERSSPEVRRRLLTTRAALARADGDLQGALEAFDEALAITQDPLGQAKLLNNTAIIQRELGRPAEAEETIRRAWSINRDTLSEDHPLALRSEIRLVNAIRAQGRPAEALPLARHALGALAGSGTLAELEASAALGNVLQQLDDPQACPQLREAVALATARVGTSHPMVGLHQVTLAGCLAQFGDPTQAAALLRDAVDALEHAHSPSLPQAQHGLADVLLALAKDEPDTRARPLLEEAKRISWASVEGTRATLGEDTPFQAGALETHVQALRALGEEDRADALAAQATAFRTTLPKNPSGR